MRISDEKKRLLANNFRLFTNSELSSMLSISPTAIRHHATSMGLVRTAEDTRLLNERARAKWRATSAATNAHERRGQSLRKTYRQEMRRVMVGEPQLTNIRINTMPRKIQQVIGRLVSRYRYVRSATNPYELIIMPNTIRVREELYSQAYHLTFTMYGER